MGKRGTHHVRKSSRAGPTGPSATTTTADRAAARAIATPPRLTSPQRRDLDPPAIARRTRITVVVLAAIVLVAGGAAPQSAANPLAFLAPLIGEWAPVLPDSVLRQQPLFRDRVVHAYEWTVGRNSIRVREGYPRGKPLESELDGQIYWDPSTQRVLFVAVAGHSDSAGRLFLGEYLRLSDGRIERIYDVLYRTKADTPGDELGGTRRRYREVYTVAPGGVTEATLDWWRDGRWAPFGRGRYAFKRILP